MDAREMLWRLAKTGGYSTCPPGGKHPQQANQFIEITVGPTLEENPAAQFHYRFSTSLLVNAMDGTGTP
jgi:hypothetical protein